MKLLKYKAEEERVEVGREPADVAGAAAGHPPELVRAVKDEVLRSLIQALRQEAVPPASERFAAERDVAAADRAALDYYEELKRFEIGMITWALRQSRGNQTAAAKLLRLRLTTLNNKIKQLDIKVHKPAALQRTPARDT